MTSAPTGMARNRSSTSASAQTVASLARLPVPALALPAAAGEAGRVATMPDTSPSASPGCCRRAEVRIVGSPVDLTVNDLILTPSLRRRLEPEVLEHRLTFFAEKVGHECRAEHLVTSSENRH